MSQFREDLLARFVIALNAAFRPLISSMKLTALSNSVTPAITMKAREMYSSSLLVAGVVSLLLGIGNWVIGAVESTKYQSLLHKTAQTGLEDSYRSFQELDHQKNEEVLRRINQDREKYNAARVKLNFFYVVLTGGRVLFLVGLMLTLWSMISLIRRDAQMKIKRLAGLPE